MTDEDWGLQRLEARRRRRHAIRNVIIFAALALVLGAPRILPAGTAGAELKLVLVCAFFATALICGWLLWRDTDEIERRLAVNMLAATGLAAVLQLALAPMALPLLAVQDPYTIILATSLGFGVIVYLVQRFLGGR